MDSTGRRNFCNSTNLICIFRTILICILCESKHATVAPVFTVRPDHTFSKGRLFYRDLSLDQSTLSLYVGAMNTFYKLNAKDINDTSRRSQFTEREILPTDQAVMNCAYKSRDQETQCQNYLRVVKLSSTDNTFLACGTNAYSPIVYKIQTDNLHVLDSSTSGTAICAVSPNDNTTAILVEKGNPHDLPSIYAATVTDFTQSNRIIYRPPLVNGKQEEIYPFMRTVHTDSKWLNEPNFVGSFDIGDQYVYFFFRETAVEFINCGKAVYSRVARICKKDVGGQNVLKQNWVTFLKARLNCSIPGEFPFYFDEIQDVVQAPDKNGDTIFYATFTTNLNGLYGSAVCAYSLKSINEVFDSGSFKDQASSSSVWLPVLPEHVPSPRPGQCVGNTKTLSDTTLHFINTHPLLDTAINSVLWKPNTENSGKLTTEPLFYKRGVVFTKIVADIFLMDDKPISVVYVATDRGEIHRILNGHDSFGNLYSKLLSIFKLSTEDIVHSMQIMPAEFLYVGQDSAVSQINLPKQCYNYNLCTPCSSDPYCVWDTSKDKCMPNLSNEIYGLQKTDRYVRFSPSNPFTSRCKVKTKTTLKVAYPGETLYISCQPSLSQNLQPGQVIWRKNGEILGLNLHRYFRTVEGGLVIVNVSSVDSGQYDCTSEGQLSDVYKLKINDVNCDTPDSIHSYKAVYKEWCREFQEYKYKMDEWSRQRSDQLQCLGRNGATRKITAPHQPFNVQFTGKMKSSDNNNVREKKR